LRHGERAEGETPSEFRVDRFVNVRFWHKADLSYVRYSVAVGCKADIEQAASKMLDL
jgi:hypothetical protein